MNDTTIGLDLLLAIFEGIGVGTMLGCGLLVLIRWSERIGRRSKTV